MIQTTFNLANPSPAPVVPSRRPPIDVRWRRFVADNPNFVPTLIRLARARKARGLRYCSMRALFELLREQPDLIEGDAALPGGRRVRLNNDFTRPMVELVSRLAPDVASMFKTRGGDDGDR